MYPNLDFVAHKHHLSQCPTLLGVAPRPLLYLLTNSFVILSFPLWSVKRKNSLHSHPDVQNVRWIVPIIFLSTVYKERQSFYRSTHCRLSNLGSNYAYSLLANKPVFAKSVEYQSELPLAVPIPCYQITFKQSGKYFELHRSHKTS